MPDILLVMSLIVECCVYWVSRFIGIAVVTITESKPSQNEKVRY